MQIGQVIPCQEDQRQVIFSTLVRQQYLGVARSKATVALSSTETEYNICSYSCCKGVRMANKIN